jgi:hypothetical protein
MRGGAAEVLAQEWRAQAMRPQMQICKFLLLGRVVTMMAAQVDKHRATFGDVSSC